MTQEIIAAGLIFILSYYTHIIHAQCELLIVYNCNVTICDGQNHYVQVRRVNNFEVLYWRHLLQSPFAHLDVGRGYFFSQFE